MKRIKERHVYVIGAGFSVGLGFPTIKDMLWNMWDELEENGLAQRLTAVIRFNHPDFNAANKDTYPNVEELLSEMEANIALFDSSRQATGKFTPTELKQIRKEFLQIVSDWFHELKKAAIKETPAWLIKVVDKMRREKADVISFNWDLVLDDLLLGSSFTAEQYGFNPTNGPRSIDGPRLIKPHGSLNWYLADKNKRIKMERQVLLVNPIDNPEDSVFAFNQFRAPISKSNRVYMPLIIAPVYSKRFEREVFQKLWRETVAVVSKATTIHFIGFSLAKADFHARFILRCGFHNQENGEIIADGSRSRPTGRAAVTIVDPSPDAHANVQGAVGWPTTAAVMTVKEWVDNDFKPKRKAKALFGPGACANAAPHDATAMTATPRSKNKPVLKAKRKLVKKAVLVRKR